MLSSKKEDSEDNEFNSIDISDIRIIPNFYS